MRLDVNLATHPYEDPRGFWLRWGSALAALALVTLVLVYITLAGWYTAAKDRRLIRERQQQLADRDREQQNAEALLNRPENRSTRDRSEFLNDAFTHKSFSWTKVFEDLEQVMPARLHVISIQPVMSADHPLELTLEVAGESRDRALELVRNMENSSHFRQTRIVQESSAVMPGSGDNVRFEINSLYTTGAASVAGQRGAP